MFIVIESVGVSSSFRGKSICGSFLLRLPLDGDAGRNDIVAVVFAHHFIVVRDEALGETLGLTRNSLVDELRSGEPEAKRAVGVLQMIDALH